MMRRGYSESITDQISMLFRLLPELRNYGDEKDFLEFMKSMKLKWLQILYKPDLNHIVTPKHIVGYTNDYKAAVQINNGKEPMPCIAFPANTKFDYQETDNLSEINLDAKYTNAFDLIFSQGKFYNDKVITLIFAPTYTPVKTILDIIPSFQAYADKYGKAHAKAKMPVEGKSSLWKSFLKYTTAGALAGLGFMAVKKLFGFESNDHDVYLIPAKYGKLIPEGFMFTDIYGKQIEHRFGNVTLAKEGYLPYGITRPTDEGTKFYAVKASCIMYQKESQEYIMTGDIIGLEHRLPAAVTYVAAVENKLLPLPAGAKLFKDKDLENLANSVLVALKAKVKNTQLMAKVALQPFKFKSDEYIGYYDEDGMPVGILVSDIQDMVNSLTLSLLHK